MDVKLKQRHNKTAPQQSKRGKLSKVNVAQENAVYLKFNPKLNPPVLRIVLVVF